MSKASRSGWHWAWSMSKDSGEVCGRENWPSWAFAEARGRGCLEKERHTHQRDRHGKSLPRQKRIGSRIHQRQTSSRPKSERRPFLSASLLYRVGACPVQSPNPDAQKSAIILHAPNACLPPAQLPSPASPWACLCHAAVRVGGNVAKRRLRTTCSAALMSNNCEGRPLSVRGMFGATEDASSNGGKWPTHTACLAARRGCVWKRGLFPRYTTSVEDEPAGAKQSLDQSSMMLPRPLTKGAVPLRPRARKEMEQGGLFTSALDNGWILCIMGFDLFFSFQLLGVWMVVVFYHLNSLYLLHLLSIHRNISGHSTSRCRWQLTT